MAETLQSALCCSHSLASPPITPPTSRISASAELSFSAVSGSHSASGRLRSIHFSPFTSNEVALTTDRGWSGVPRAQPELQERSAAAPDDGVKWWERDLGATLRDVHSALELTDAVAAAKGKLVVVEFFASWCGSCRALYPKLCKLAAEHQDIVFVKVNFDENKAFCKSLNIKVLPYFHFYRGTPEQLDSFSCSITKLQKLKDAIAKYNVGGQHVNAESSLNYTGISTTTILDEQ